MTFIFRALNVIQYILQNVVIFVKKNKTFKKICKFELFFEIQKHEVGISSNELLRIQSWIYFSLLLLIAHHSKKINFNRILKKSKIFLKKLIFLLKLLILILITNF